MKSLSTPFLFLLLSLFALVLSCKKEDPAPTPTTPLGSAITANPTVTGLTNASVTSDASGSTYTITVPAETDIKNLKISIPLTTGSTITPDPTTAHDYTNPVTYTITKTDGSKQTVTVKVVVMAAPKSTEKQITTFSFAALSPVVSATIEQSSRIISATIPAATDLTNLVPTITTSAKANVSPASGVAQNFTNPVNYTVTAEDGSTQVYEVKVEKQTVGSSKACLLTRSEYTSTSNGKQTTLIIEYDYDATGRITSIKFYDSGNSADAQTTKISYDTNGDVAEIQRYDRSSLYLKMKHTYVNGKVTKMEVFDSNNNLLSDFIASGRCKFNSGNELIEYNEANDPKSEGRYIVKYEYKNHNITRSEFYDDDDKSWSKVNFVYDNKPGPLYSSNPHPIITASFFYGLPFEWYGINNMVSAKTDDGKTLSLSPNYKYNANNYPTEITGTDTDGKPFGYKFSYSNCQ